MTTDHKYDRDPNIHGSCGKKYYEPPKILFQEPLEAIAATCQQQGGKESGTLTCAQGPINS